MTDPTTSAYAATVHAQASYIPWFERLDIPQIIAAAAIMIVAWFMIRTIKQIDANQRATAETLAQLTRDFYKLLGEHSALHNNSFIGRNDG